ncbi:MAG: superoxide reductase [Desulfobacteraceae bacterium Eth-SRB2]|nr:MAG: superoxide reductase [Desulfobacteraceae bacterium Eth-SRB2]
MKEKHGIEWVEIIADGKTYRQYLNPGEVPEAIFNVKAEHISIREYCNLHGLFESIKEVIIWQIGNLQIEDIRWKLMHYLTSVHPAKKNASSSTTPVIRLAANLKASIKGYKGEKNG